MATKPSKVVPGTLSAPRNHWYVAALSQELGEAPLARMLLGDEVVLFRTESGKVAALEDRCAHRAVALSAGKVFGDTIRCFYHGITYGTDGACASIPSQTQIPPKMCVRSYPVVERDHMIWIWMGDAAGANPDDILDLTEFGISGALPSGQKAQVCPMFLMEIEGNYQLVHENLLDNSHISYLHEGSFDSGAICDAPATIRNTGNPNHILVEREVEETIDTMAFAMAFELPMGMRMRRILRSQSWAPGFNVVSNLMWDLDKPESELLFHHSIFPITPKDDRTTHYFSLATKSHGEEPYSEQTLGFVWEVFLTDKAAIEAQQRSYDKLGLAAPDVSVLADGAAIRFRRVLERQMHDDADTGRMEAA